MTSVQPPAAILAAIMGALMPSGCMVVEDPQHCANREGDKTCEELYEPGVRCSACEHFFHGCVSEPPAPECRVEDTDAASSSEDDGSSGGTEVECDDCPDDDAGSLEAIR